MDVQGSLVATFVRGHAVVRDGALVARPGTGRLVRPAELASADVR
jgi:N-acyl-D-aspartate/D-glutamate deacylase